MALLLVLAIVTVLATMAYTFHDLVLSKLVVARKDVDRFRSLQLARAGITLVEALLKMDTRPVFFVPGPDYAQKMSDQGQVLSKIEEAYLALGTGMGVPTPFGEGTVTVTISDESGRVNINRAPPHLLYNLFRVLDVRRRKKLTFSDTESADPIYQQLTHALLDWIDPDDAPRPEGAEKSWYRQQEARYVPRNGPFQTLEEIRLVRWVDPTVYEGRQGSEKRPAVKSIEPYLTVHGPDARVNVNMTSPEVIASLPGIFESPNRNLIVEKVLEFRPFRAPGEFQSILNSVDSEAFRSCSQFLKWQSDTFRVIAKAEMGIYKATITAVLKKSAQPPFHVLYWKEE